ncbi:restriction endonuclease subunit S [Halobacillus litoralis]|uniref:restriction endonuclease subunit S n=1 Tax=Halobacillus litoralis TaxID=45668 RepID=UPI0024919895|nr:restriction endonuclease subunit S [Halobacillus litoralis]
MENKQTPEIRFPGFTGDWEQRKLGEISTFINGRAYKQDELLLKGKYKVLRVGNFYTNKNWYYSNLELEEKYYANDGDLLYTWSATFGPHIYHGEKVIYHYHIWKVELSCMLNKYFTVHLLEYDKEKITNDKNGSTMVHITKKGMEEKQVTIPSIDEQKQMGNFFKQLDDSIAVHEQELTTFTQTKQGFLQKMFPKEGESVPEIRFPGFTGNWKQGMLGDFTETSSGGTPSAGNKLYYDGEIPFIRSAEINSESTELFITEEGFKNSSAKMVKKGDILYALYGATSGEVGLSKINGAINQAVLVMKPKFGDDSYFISQWLKKQKPRIISTYLQGGQGNLSGSIVRKLIITIPSNKDEQIKIGSFFKQLDDTIAFHERELDILKETKKAFLQKMFV